RRANIPGVAACEVLYHHPLRQPLQDIVSCIRQGTTLAQAGTLLRCNAEHALRPPAVMQRLYADRPEWLRQTEQIAERCGFELGQLHYRYPSAQDPHASLRHHSFAGAHARYQGRLTDAIVRQLEHELQIIEELDYGGYFLTMFEVVNYCRAQKILCQGRGSAANSVVCYCLGITAIDPIGMQLLFERFISRERAEPPDIDLDIEHNRREQVIQWVYETYGRRHAAMVANVVRFRLRSAVRQVGKALGVAPVNIEALAKLVGSYDSTLEEATMQTAGFDPQAPLTQHLLQHSQAILDFPRHLSIHPGGFLLGHEPVDTLVPIEHATMERRTVIQWDKQDVEDLGLFKVDLLGLGALSHIRLCFELIEQHEQMIHSLASIPSDDAATYAMICRADTIGVFQIESRAQMSMLPRLRPNKFYDLVVEVAIVRPGPIQGDMVHPYLRRRTGQEQPDYPHPSFKRILGKTYGVPIFQEQVMKIAIETAGYSPGEADQLRRDMAAWRSSGRIETHHEVLVQRMVGQGVPLSFAERIFAQIRGFGEYGFPESHAASFAHIAYVTAYLKCHHPAAFSCALLNAQPMGFYNVATIVEDAKRHGILVLPIDINQSAWDCTLQRPTKGGALAIRMGLRHIKGFGEPERALLGSMPPAQPYRCISDLSGRTQLPQKSLLLLATCGALRGLGPLRRDALWEVRGQQAQRDDVLQLASRPDAQPQFAPLSRGEALIWDFKTSFHSAHGHPMQNLRTQLQRATICSSRDINRCRSRASVHHVGMVICRQRPQTASGVAFFTLEDEFGMVNLVLWKQVFATYYVLAKTQTLLGVSGKVQNEAGTVHLVAHTLWSPQTRLQVAGMRVKNFQ
ncbi:MAG: DNA polymerase III subunit alpha, partial [Deltaproteobacteria bacterium]